MVFVANVKRLIQQHGLIGGNQSELARKATMDQAYINKLLKGKNSISLTYLDKIAGALGVEPWCLLVEGDWPLSNPPVRAPLTDLEKRLYESMKESAKIAVEISKGGPAQS